MKGQCLVSPSGRFNFQFQGDGNAVVYDSTAGAIWASSFSAPGVIGAGQHFYFQGDGNLVIYGNNGALWNSRTDTQTKGFLQMQDDGNLVLYTAANSAVWSSKDGVIRLNAAQLPPPSPYISCTSYGAAVGVNTNFVASSNQCLVSPNGRYAFVFQSDGNAVVYDKTTAIWAKPNLIAAGRLLSFQADGNLVIYNSNGSVAWAAGTNGKNAEILQMQDDGNLVIYASGGKALWASKNATTTTPAKPATPATPTQPAQPAPVKNQYKPVITNLNAKYLACGVPAYTCIASIRVSGDVQDRDYLSGHIAVNVTGTINRGTNSMRSATCNATTGYRASYSIGAIRSDILVGGTSFSCDLYPVEDLGGQAATTFTVTAYDINSLGNRVLGSTSSATVTFRP